MEYIKKKNIKDCIKIGCVIEYKKKFYVVIKENLLLAKDGHTTYFSDDTNAIPMEYNSCINMLDITSIYIPENDYQIDVFEFLNNDISDILEKHYNKYKIYDYDVINRKLRRIKTDLKNISEFINLPDYSEYINEIKKIIGDEK